MDPNDPFKPVTDLTNTLPEPSRLSQQSNTNTSFIYILVLKGLHFLKDGYGVARGKRDYNVNFMPTFT